MKNEKNNSAKEIQRKTLVTYFIAACFMLVLGMTAPIDSMADEKNDSISFALIGDMPYNASQREEFINLMEEINQSELAFVIHAGDFWYDGLAWNESSEGLSPCSDEVMNDRLALANASAHPFIFVPGDNEWTDCHRAKPEGHDPLERLAKLRDLFYPDTYSLGKKKISLSRQGENDQYREYRENSRWEVNNVMFVTVHMVGSNNNLGRTEEMDGEYSKRNAANIAWLEESFALADKNKNAAVMIIAHANPRFENTWSNRIKRRYFNTSTQHESDRQATGYDDFLNALEAQSIEFARPVFYAHGDSHTFRIDKPLFDSFSGRLLENFTRVETFGYPDTHWIRGTIDTKDPNILRFDQLIVEQNTSEH